MTDVPFSCACGQIKGTLHHASPRSGTHAVCYCASCRAGEVYSGAPDPAPEPVGIFQTSPHLMTLTTGHDQLSVFSFGPENLLRWKADCCGMAMFNTPRNPKLSFIGVRTTAIPDTTPIGPVIAKGFIPVPGKKSRHENLTALLVMAIWRMLKSLVTGRWKANPLFDTAAGTPLHPVVVVSAEERAKLPL